ncbi:MAG: hypothetical protein ABJF23_12255 [Bryobacteraceae bacterium]
MNFVLQRSRVCTLTYSVVLASLLLAAAQPSMAEDETTMTGTVASFSRNTLTLKSANGQYQLFVVDRNTRKPATLAQDSNVRVTSISGDEPGVRLAKQITAFDPSTANQTSSEGPVVPPEIRRVERDIERQALRFQLGVRAGVALDPELVLIGAQVQIGPFFSQDVFFRPNVEFAYGEVTALFALNPEVIYRLPMSSRQGRWSTYVGAGPGFNFLHQNFERTDGSGKRIDFGDFHSDVGLNILGGIRYRGGMFAELKTSVYSDPSPTLRLMVGYNF